MKKSTAAAALALALALGSAPAMADNKSARGEVEITGVVKTVLDAKTLSVYASHASPSRDAKALASAIEKAAAINISMGTNVVIHRGTSTAFTAIAVGDRVSIRATCTLPVAPATVITCVATRVNATAAPTPTPAPQHLNFDITGVVVANTAGTLQVVVVKASDGDDNPLDTHAILGTKMTVLTDTSTVVVKKNVTVPTGVASLVDFPAITASGACTATAPVACTAKRITVIAA